MSILRTAPAAMIAALAGGVELFRADLFEFDLVDGVSQFFWTSWNKDLSANGNDYVSAAPWLQRDSWKLTNSMEVPTMNVYLMAKPDAWNSGPAIKEQIHDGLFDGATFLLSRTYMSTPGDTTTLGVIDLFKGIVAGITIDATKATITTKGKTNLLAQNAPRNLYQAGCNLNFCGARCSLNRSDFTDSYTVGSSPIPSATFIPWASAPPNPTNYIGGTLAITSGAGDGQRRFILTADSSGLTLGYPLYVVPSTGDDFTAFQGCDKTFNSGTGRSCTDRSNTQNYDGFEYVPPPNTAV